MAVNPDTLGNELRFAFKQTKHNRYIVDQKLVVTTVILNGRSALRISVSNVNDHYQLHYDQSNVDGAAATIVGLAFTQYYKVELYHQSTDRTISKWNVGHDLLNDNINCVKSILNSLMLL